MKNEYVKAISALSPENKKRFGKVIKNLETLAEATPVGDPIFFNPATYLGSDGYDERTIVAKLEEWGVLTAEPEELNYGLLVFTTLEKLHEMRSLLGGHASSSLDYVANIGMEEFYKDEIQLVNKLLQICNEKTESVVLMRPAHLAMSHTDKAGFDHLEVLQDLQTQHKVFSSFKPSLNLIDLKHVAIIEARIDFAKLNERAESLHDDVESWKGVVLGKEQQKKELLRRLREEFEKYPQEQYERSEKILGSYRPENPEKPMGYSLFQPDKNRPDIRYRFMEAMRALERDGHFVIEGVEIDFNVQPRPTGQSHYNRRWSLGERSLEFYPPEHCKVTIRPTGRKKTEETRQNLIAPSERKKPKCEVKGGVGFVRLGGKESKPFKKLNGRQWKLVKQLVESFGLAKTDETTYENIALPTDSKHYPELFGGDSYHKAPKIHSIIENTIAELQRNFAQSALAGLFSIHHDGKKVWMDFLQ